MLRYVPLRAREQILSERHKYQLLLDESKFCTVRHDDLHEDDSRSDSDDDTHGGTDSEDLGIEMSVRSLSYLV